MSIYENWDVDEETDQPSYIDPEDVAYEDRVSSDTAPTGEDFHLEMDYEDRYSDPSDFAGPDF